MTVALGPPQENKRTNAPHFLFTVADALKRKMYATPLEGQYFSKLIPSSGRREKRKSEKFFVASVHYRCTFCSRALDCGGVNSLC
jgi:hypothetical protein